MKYLVDTSVWISHFNRKDTFLRKQLEEDNVIIHTFIIGELACGNLKNRKEILELLNVLPRARVINDNELLYFIEEHLLYGKKVGLIDVHLLASAMVENIKFVTYDKKLQNIANNIIPKITVGIKVKD